MVQAAMKSGFSKQEVYTFDKYPNLYLKDNQIVKIIWCVIGHGQ